jgi:hypothetical protein
MPAMRLLTDRLICSFSLSMRPQGVGAWRDPLAEVGPPPGLVARTPSDGVTLFSVYFLFFQFVIRDVLIRSSHICDATFKMHPALVSVLV